MLWETMYRIVETWNARAMHMLGRIAYWEKNQHREDYETQIELDLQRLERFVEKLRENWDNR